jgi:signal transduction histidine kinase
VALGGVEREKAAEIIHDLRNSLALVISYANLVAHDLQDRPDVTDDLTEIGSAGRRAAELVGELSAVIVAEEG